MTIRYVFFKDKYPVGSAITLPYGVHEVKIYANGGSATIKEIGGVSTAPVSSATPIKFPIIDGKSPNVFHIEYWSEATRSVEFLIMELGGIPDPNYFTDTPTVIPEIISDEQTGQEEKKDAI